MRHQDLRAERKKKDAQMANVIVVVGTMFFGFFALISFMFIFTTVQNYSAINSLQPKDFVMPMIACFGVLLAVLAFMRDWNKLHMDRMETNAKILHEQAKEGLEGALKLLKDAPQDPQAWLDAARLILQSQELGKNIDGHSYYATAYEIAERNTQIKLRQALMPNGSPLPAAFFFGYEIWSDPNLDLNDVHNKTQAGNHMYTVGPQSNTVLPDPKSQQINQQSVIVIMNFIRETENISQNDPLSAIDPDVYTTWPEYNGVAQGARKYINKLRNP